MAARRFWGRRALALLCASLLLAAGYFGLPFPQAVADVSPDPQPSYLAVIRYENWDDVQRLVGLGLNLLDWQADRLAALLTSTQLASVRTMGIEVQVLDGPQESKAAYYLAVRPPGAQRPIPEGCGQVFPYVEGTFLFKAGPEGADCLARKGFSIQKLVSPIVLPDTAPSSGVHATPIRVQIHSPLIEDLVNSVSQTQLYTTVLNLQDDESLAGWDAERSRYTYSPELDFERDYVRDRMQALELDVGYQPFYLGENIEGVLEGWGLGDEVVYIVSAHYDAMSEDPYNLTPGADDNASGVAAVLEAARLLSRYRFRHTLRFVTFAAEEQGLIGSRDYAWQARMAGTPIGGVINLDMIAWDSNDDNLVEIHTGLLSDSQSLGVAFMDANATYAIGLVPKIIISEAGGRSDHASFWRQGYPAILVIEDHADFNPYYHRTSDTLDKLDLAYATRFVQATVATLAEVAEIIPPGVSVEHTGPEWLRPGQVTTFTLQYANPGPDLAAAVVITDTLSPELTYLADTSNLVVTQPNSDTVAWQVGELEPYTRASFVMTAALEIDVPAGAQLTSTVSISGTTAADDPADNQATWTGLVPYAYYLPAVYRDGNQ
jgi:uncharacterized repeat protein (TIGR01451 family)